ncbi:hypothetical protein HU718_016775 [Pseudomonas tensinigenes]|uniref:Transposase n=1 Tax=Pseudomonas tensinigenes TaxID=2745511 RepID=A0ABX8PRB7_9PSED|nr:hypothetical protein [Pseudomonas tensinigenes]QXI03690.1 hypothetical protein HU718_016775 [Pseudomonas tensinigenes]
MNSFKEALLVIPTLKSRKSRNRFFRDFDRWSNRIFTKGLINLHQRQELRLHIAGAYIATLM